MGDASESSESEFSSPSEYGDAGKRDVRLPEMVQINVSDSLLDDEEKKEDNEDNEDKDPEVELVRNTSMDKQNLEDNIQAGLERRVKKFKPLDPQLDESDEEDNWRSKLV